MALERKRIVTVILIICVALAGIIAYRIYANLAANKERAGRFSQGRAAAVEVGIVGRRDLTPRLLFAATLEPEWSADLSPKADGRVDRLLVDEGSKVKAGMVIAELDTSELAAQVIQAEGNLAVAQANLVQAELDLNRTEPLAKQGAVSVQALDAARIKRDLAMGQLRSAQGNLALLKAKYDSALILAPRDGIVIKRYLQAGYFAKAGAPIVGVADVTKLVVKATVGEGQIADLTIGAPAQIIINALGNKELSGTLSKISPMAALPARTFVAEITVDNPQNMLKPGMYAKVVMQGNVRKKALVVPESAMVMREDQKTVFKVTADNKVQQQVLKIGYVGDGWAEVLEGVKEGERIVVAGVNKIKDGSMIQVSGAREGGKN